MNESVDQERIYKQLDDFLGALMEAYESRVAEIDPKFKPVLLPLLTQGQDAYVVSTGDGHYLILALLRDEPAFQQQTSFWDESDYPQLANAKTPEDVCRIVQITTPYWIEKCPTRCDVSGWLDSSTAQRIGKQIAERDIARYPFEFIASLVETWTPTQRYKTEEGYKAELAQFIRAYGIPVAQEQGVSQADIVAAERVAIALKKKPNKGDYDLLFSQIHRHLGEYEFAVAVVTALDKTDAFDAFAKRFADDVRVKCIPK